LAFIGESVETEVREYGERGEEQSILNDAEREEREWEGRRNE
jgi:hypothetical protein